MTIRRRKVAHRAQNVYAAMAAGEVVTVCGARFTLNALLRLNAFAYRDCPWCWAR